MSNKIVMEKKTNKDGKGYIDYCIDTEGVKNTSFRSNEVFAIDTESDEYLNIVKNVGGFTANMTSRMLENNPDINCKTIALVSLPKSDPTKTSFVFVYLDENDKPCEIDNYGRRERFLYDPVSYDFVYFRDKFAKAKSDRLPDDTYELVKLDEWKELLDEIDEDINDMSIFTIDGEQVEFYSRYRSDSPDTLSIYKENVANNVKNAFQFMYITPVYNPMSGFRLKITLENKNGDTVSSDFATKGEEDKHSKYHPFETEVSLRVLKNCFNLFKKVSE